MTWLDSSWSESQTWLTARLKTADAVLLAEAIGSIARSILTEPGYPGSPDEARADAVGVLVTPTRAGAATVQPGAATLVVHLDRADLTQPDSVAAVGRVQGPGGLDAIGPVLLDQVRELVAHRRVRVLPVIDLAGDPGVDAYEIPERLQAQVDLRDGFSVFPFATQAARACDHDHTLPWRAAGPPGQTRPSNLAVLDRSAHRAKTHGGWQVRQPEPGVFDWTSPLGYRYRVDHHGTHRLDDPHDGVDGAPIGNRRLRGSFPGSRSTDAEAGSALKTPSAPQLLERLRQTDGLRRQPASKTGDWYDTPEHRR